MTFQHYSPRRVLVNDSLTHIGPDTKYIIFANCSQISLPLLPISPPPLPLLPSLPPYFFLTF